MYRRRSLLASCLALVIAVTIAAPVAAGQVRLRVTAAQSSMSIGSVAVGQESATQVVYVTNRSIIPVRWTGSGFSYGLNGFGSWVVASSGASGMTASCFDLPDVTIQPGQTCAMHVFTFKPAATGAYSLLIGMRFTDGVGVFDLWVSVKGKGV